MTLMERPYVCEQSMQASDTHRILAIVRHPVGGVRTHIVYTYPTLVRAGYHFTFVIPQSEYHAYAPFRADVESWDGTEIVEVPYTDRARPKPKFLSTVRRLLKQGRFSLIHSHGIQAAVPTVLANIGIGLPHVMTSQDVFCHVDLAGVAGRLKLRGLQSVLRRLDVLVAVSEDTRDDHLHYLPGLRKGPCRIEVIHNGIDLARYPLHNGKREDCPLREELGIGPNTFLLGFLGRFMEQKGFLYLVEALDRLLESDCPARPVHLLAVGSGDMLVNYQWELDRYPHAKRCLTFREHVANVGPILRELDLLVMPSLWEACPILPMEALCTGVPVLGTDCVGLREVLRGTPARMVPPRRCGRIAHALHEALEQDWTIDARAYISEARQRFDVQSVGSTLHDLYESAARRARAMLAVWVATLCSGAAKCLWDVSARMLSRCASGSQSSCGQ